MNRKPLMAGNWKMHLLAAEAESLVKELIAGLDGTENVDVAVAPAYPWLVPVAKALSGSGVALAAQNLHWEDFGAFTGEVCAKMLRDAGCTYVIVGHSERRQYFNETNQTVNKRLKAALAEGLIPILCVGETLDERKGGLTQEVVEKQIREGLEGISREEMVSMVIAYEPVWAIGTGGTATPEQAQEVHAGIRALLRDLYDEAIAQGLRIQYGGSVKPANVNELMAKPDIDGALVGGASLKADSFLGIVKFQA